MPRAVTLRTVLVVSAALALVTPALGELYNQPSNFPAGSAFASMFVRGGDDPAFATAYDDFTLASAATITGVKWRGAFFLPPNQMPITQFTLTFYSSNNATGEPNTGNILNQTIAAGNAAETLVGTNGILRAYDYQVALFAPFAASGGTRYWLSIVPETTAATPQWGWATGTGGNGRMWEDFHHVANWGTSDLAFTVVPEPSTLLMLLGGLLAAGVLWRRVRA